MIDLIRDLIVGSGPLINRSLSAGIAIIAASFLMHALVNGLRNRVARVYGVLLFFVLMTYIGDLGVGYSAPQSIDATVPWLKLQWVGIAYVPVVYTHLSDAILELTGLPSRGRRRRAIAITYLIATAFFALVMWSDLVVHTPVSNPAPHFNTGPLFPVFLLYFIGAVIVAFWFVVRARNRTLTPATNRRMTALLFTYAAPALSVFPFLLVTGPSLDSEFLFYLVLVVADTILAVMLSYMSYVLAFFGTTRPDRLIKAQMLQFFLRGPVVAIIVLGVIVWGPSAGRILNLPDEEVTTFAVVATILALQWLITISKPLLERAMIYGSDHAEIQRIQQLERRLLSGADFHQLLDSILGSICDYLRVETAFVASISSDGPQLERSVGLHDISPDGLPDPQELDEQEDVFVWEDFWLIPLYSVRTGSDALIGVLGVAAPAEPETEADEDERWAVLMALAARTAEVLDDRRLQREVFTALEGLLPDMKVLQQLRGMAQYKGIEVLTKVPTEEVISGEDFAQKVKDALQHYWGGPKLTDSSLMQLEIVKRSLEENEGNPQRAMRAVLTDAIENLRPEGTRSLTTAEWILYNILEMRFIQGRKVRDVTRRLAMSEADFYRKQKVAIESVAEIIALSERAAAEDEPGPIQMTGENDTIEESG